MTDKEKLDMRTIKFRGKAATGGWVYGSLLTWPDGKTMVYDTLLPDGSMGGTEVDPETVGEFTGLLDKDGREVYEGDILLLRTFDNQSWTGTMEHDHEIRELFTLEELKGRLEEESVTPVRYEDGTFFVGLSSEGDTYLSCLFGDMKASQPIFECEVVGNVHDGQAPPVRYSQRWEKG